MDKNELKRKLTSEQYRVTQEKGTEAPFSGKFVDHFEQGMYACVVCGTQLFASDAKYKGEHGPEGLRGWPSFDQALPGAVKFLPDDSHGMHRTEVVCANCGAHLGHLFDDPTAPSGKHFCINSVCLEFKDKDGKK